jgi:hypothetical protein
LREGGENVLQIVRFETVSNRAEIEKAKPLAVTHP